MKGLETEALNPCLESEKILFQLIQELDCLVPNFMVTHSFKFCRQGLDSLLVKVL